MAARPDSRYSMSSEKIPDEILMGNSPRAIPLAFDEVAVHFAISVAPASSASQTRWMGSSLSRPPGRRSTSGNSMLVEPRVVNVRPQNVKRRYHGYRRQSGHIKPGGAPLRRRQWHLWLSILGGPMPPYISFDGYFDASARKVMLRLVDYHELHARSTVLESVSTSYGWKQ